MRFIINLSVETQTFIRVETSLDRLLFTLNIHKNRSKNPIGTVPKETVVERCFLTETSVK